MAAIMCRSLLLIAIICTIPGIFAKRHLDDRHHEHSEDEDDTHHSPDDTDSSTCIKRGDSGEPVPLRCPFGCCGGQGDQFCCDETDTGASQDYHIHKSVIIALGILSSLLFVSGALCVGFGVYKHTKANQRKTTPTRSTVPVPYYTGRPVIHLEKKKPPQKVQKEAPVSDNDDYSLYTVTEPPRYETVSKRNNELPSLRNPPARADALLQMERPPPYDLIFTRDPPLSTYTS